MEIHSVRVSRGLDWFGEGFRYFRDNPLIWIVITVIYVAIHALLSLVPLLGSIAGALLQPVLLAGMLAGCRDLDQGEELHIEHLFDGFRNNVKPLLTVGLLIMLAYMALAILLAGMLIGSGLFGTELVEQEILTGNWSDLRSGMAVAGLVLVALVGLVLWIPIAMAGWFAPALVMFQGMDAIEALKTSFLGCWKNLLPFLVYGLLAFLLIALVAVTAGLALLIVVPMVLGSVYAAYRDIFPEGAPT